MTGVLRKEQVIKRDENVKVINNKVRDVLHQIYTPGGSVIGE